MRHRPGVSPGRTVVAITLVYFTAFLSAAAQNGADVYREIVLTLDTAASEAAPVVEVTSGERIRLVLHGLGTREVHLHGYDRHLHGHAGPPARLELEAAHSGRFPAMVHTHDDLLGDREEALFYLEVRAR